MRRFLNKLYLGILLLLLSAFTAKSAHIVGGDFSYKHISGDTYQFKMKMYRDCGGGGAMFENILRVGIYNKENDELVREISMPRTTIYPIKFNTGCTSPQLRCVETGVFVVNVTLSKDFFNNTGGYYIQWERCCRNDIIKNIQNPGATPMAFVMEFPSPYPAGGSQRINSSPEFLRDPLNYLCVGEPFKYDFKIYDADGDELRMRMGIPNAGGYTSINRPMQNTGPAPYDDVIWASGYGFGFPTNIMDGNPDLYVDNDTAFIYLVPQQIGVYVISVICDEYRDNVKIGEVVRELQLEVLDCPPRFKPNITANLPGGKSYVEAEIGKQVCFELDATDFNSTELIRFRVDTGGLYKVIGTDATLDPSDAAGTQQIKTTFCWTPKCPVDTSKGAFIDFIAFDNSCPFSQDDTIRVKFVLKEENNIAPIFKSTLTNNVFNVRTNENLCFQFQAIDSNAKDEIVMQPIVKNVDVFNLGASVTPVLAGNALVNGEFCWTPPCGLNIDTPIHIGFILTDNACPVASIDTIDIVINVLPLLNEAPTVLAEGVIVGANNTVALQLDEENCFSIYAEDLDLDDIELYTQNVNYDFIANGAKFTTIENNPNSKRIQICYTPTCDNFYEETLYLDVLTRDRKCENEKFDTIRVKFEINVPSNVEPLMLKPDSVVYNINAGYARSIDVEGSDEDNNDLLILSARPLFNSNIPFRIDMNTTQGIGIVSNQLTVYPDCGLENNQDYPVELSLLSNKYCNEYDTITKVVYFRVAPLLDIDKPLVPDVFSPNGDGINDEYKIYLANRTVCPDEFEFLIFDRWGKKILQTKDPEFIWRGENCTAGAYVYYLRIGEDTFTGFIALVK